METLSLKFTQLDFASEKISALKKKIDNSPFGLMDETNNDEKWKYYTGFHHKGVKTIFKYVDTFIPTTTTTALVPFNQLLLTLIKLRLDHHFKDLAYHFKIAPTTASSYFETVINILYARFKCLIIWPEYPTCQKNIPTCFKEVFHDKSTVIIDCFEVFIEKPSNLLTQQQCWSNYKHHQTVKFLIGITPQGTISYISNAWGGRASDKQIVELSNFCEKIKPGDIVLADRGFLIKDILGIFNAKLVIPAFTKGKDQLCPIELEDTRQLAHVRIHVERIIGVIKNKFNFFKGVIPVSMIRRNNSSEELCLLDKIVTVCCCLTNLSPPIIPL